MDFRSERYFRPVVADAEQRNRAVIESLLSDCEIEHVGSTAVAGALTKGDLDLLVRVSTAEFAAAVGALRERYEVNQPENWTAGFASFTERDASDIPVGVQLVAAGDQWDGVLVSWCKRLNVDPAVRERYNELKRDHAGSDPETYREAKDRFIESELGLG